MNVVVDDKFEAALVFGDGRREPLGSLTRPWDEVEASLCRGFSRLREAGNAISDGGYYYALGFLQSKWNRLNLTHEEAEERKRRAFEEFNLSRRYPSRGR